jgi:hypothetical protein
MSATVVVVPMPTPTPVRVFVRFFTLLEEIL